MSIAAYKQTIRESESPRQIERRVLTRVTAALERHAEGFDTAVPGRRHFILAQGLREALTDNQALWRALRHDLADSGNRLPEGIRAALISISLWVDRQSTQVLGGKPGLDALIEVNRRIIAGLAGQAPRPGEV
ncbi:flagellar biosynthesis regulator FlaF [Roseivivax isoporae]|uniref:FlaF protein n=1 Tax=Roseivivax isoporae LMG 25204 TaxID=1449351 RepID=X7F9X8_9RHOB|nr:flagellar biosynthesis regulator FlaF [Roseivivax isoporae]ETX28899.1 flaF protein [Roseivivax isoporae LMG 25204]